MTTTNTAIEKRERPANGFGEMIQQAPQQQGLKPTVVPLDRETLLFYSNMITMAGLVPTESNISPEMSKNRVMAKVVAGCSYGFDPILSQQCFDVLFNRMTPNAHGMEILFRDSGEYDTRIKVLNDLGCTVIVLQRKGGTWDETRGQYIGGDWHAIGEVEFTVAMAKQAGWTKNALWSGTPADMCYSKVMKRVVKRFNPTCLRPRTLLGNHFAKAHQPQIASPVPEAPQIAAPSEPANTAPEVVAETQPYIDPPFIEAEEISGEAVIQEYSGEVVDADEADEADEPRSEESIIEDLRTAIKDKMNALPSREAQDILNGRKVTSMDKKQLTSFLAELN